MIQSDPARVRVSPPTDTTVYRSLLYFEPSTRICWPGLKPAAPKSPPDQVIVECVPPTAGTAAASGAIPVIKLMVPVAVARLASSDTAWR